MSVQRFDGPAGQSGKFLTFLPAHSWGRIGDALQLVQIGREQKLEQRLVARSFGRFSDNVGRQVASCGASRAITRDNQFAVGRHTPLLAVTKGDCPTGRFEYVMEIHSSR